MIRGYQVRKAADKKFEEAAMTRKKAEDFLTKLKTPAQLLNALSELGYDPRQLAESYLSDQLNYELMSPEQKEAYQLKIENQKYREEKERFEKEQQEQGRDAVTKQTAMDLQKQIIDVLDKNKLPKKFSTVSRIARKMLVKMDAEIPSNPNDVVVEVAREIMQEHKDLYGDLTGEQLIELLGEGNVKKMRQADLSRLPNPIASTRRPGEARPEKKPERGYRTEKEIDAYLRMKKAGK